MKRTALAIGFVVPVVLFGAQAPQPDRSLVIEGGTLIDLRQGRLAPNTVILVQGDRIAQVGAAGQVARPAGAQVVNAQGKFVMPGLWDSHAHTRDYDAALNITHGVTSTMDMGNIQDWIIALGEGRNKGLIFGPRIFPQTMSLGGELGFHQWNLQTVGDARWAARTNIEAGAAFLKVYQQATPEMIKAVVEEADKAGLNVTGHFQKADAREAILAGIDALAHGSGIGAATAINAEAAAKIKERGPEIRRLGFGGPLANYLQDTAKFDELIELMIDRNVRLEPNIVTMFKGIYPQSDRFMKENLQLGLQADELRIPPSYVRNWSVEGTFQRPTPPDLWDKLKKGLANHQLFARKFAAAGGKLLVGTDAYIYMPSGLAMWHEMELLADAGVPAAAILKGATINAAEFVHQEKNLGAIEPGRQADILVLGRNPLADINNIRSIETVIAHGGIQKLGYERRPAEKTIPRPYFTNTPGSPLPRPYLTSITPIGVPVNSGPATLTIKGRDFNRDNRVLWDGVDLEVTKFSPTEVQVVVPAALLRDVGKHKVNMITGGFGIQEGPDFYYEESFNYQDVLVTFGKTINQRWNGQTKTNEF